MLLQGNPDIWLEFALLLGAKYAHLGAVAFAFEKKFCTVYVPTISWHIHTTLEQSHT